MNEFQYNIKYAKLLKLTTKKTKKEFIDELRFLQGTPTYWDFKLLSDAITLITDTSIPGVKSLATVSSSWARKLFWVGTTLEEINRIIAITPRGYLDKSNVVNDFMYTSGIPASIKLAIIREQLLYKQEYQC